MEDDYIDYPDNMNDLRKIMLEGEQSIGVNYYMHGEQVAAKFEELLNLAKEGQLVERMNDYKPRWRLPRWLVLNQKWIYQQLAPKQSLYKTYHIWHDCGKPLVKKLDHNNQSHYPDHSAVSAKAWLKAGGDEITAILIENDMVCHHLRSVEETKQLSQNDEHFLALMVTAVCEMHVCQPPISTMNEENVVCNSDLTTTDGFKIKFKRIEYYGKIMMKILSP